MKPLIKYRGGAAVSRIARNNTFLITQRAGQHEIMEMIILC